MKKPGHGALCEVVLGNLDLAAGEQEAVANLVRARLEKARSV